MYTNKYIMSASGSSNLFETIQGLVEKINPKIREYKPVEPATVSRNTQLKDSIEELIKNLRSKIVNAPIIPDKSYMELQKAIATAITSAINVNAKTDPLIPSSSDTDELEELEKVSEAETETETSQQQLAAQIAVAIQHVINNATEAAKSEDTPSEKGDIEESDEEVKKPSAKETMDTDKSSVAAQIALAVQQVINNASAAPANAAAKTEDTLPEQVDTEESDEEEEPSAEATMDTDKSSVAAQIATAIQQVNTNTDSSAEANIIQRSTDVKEAPGIVGEQPSIKAIPDTDKQVIAAQVATAIHNAVSAKAETKEAAEIPSIETIPDGDNQAIAAQVAVAIAVAIQNAVSSSPAASTEEVQSAKTADLAKQSVVAQVAAAIQSAAQPKDVSPVQVISEPKIQQVPMLTSEEMKKCKEVLESNNKDFYVNPVAKIRQENKEDICIGIATPKAPDAEKGLSKIVEIGLPKEIDTLA